MKVFLGPLYMEKSCPGKEACHPSPVIFREHFYEEKTDPFAKSQEYLCTPWLFCLDSVDLAGWAKVFIWWNLAQQEQWPTILDNSRPWDSESRHSYNSMCITSYVVKSRAVSLQIHIPYPFPTQYNVDCALTVSILSVGWGDGVGTCSISSAWIQFCVC